MIYGPANPDHNIKKVTMCFFCYVSVGLYNKKELRGRSKKEEEDQQEAEEEISEMWFSDALHDHTLSLQQDLHQDEVFLLLLLLFFFFWLGVMSLRFFFSVVFFCFGRSPKHMRE